MEENTNFRIGRNRELNLLTSYLECSEESVAVIKGGAGIGKMLCRDTLKPIFQCVNSVPLSV